MGKRSRSHVPGKKRRTRLSGPPAACARAHETTRERVVKVTDAQILMVAVAAVAIVVPAAGIIYSNARVEGVTRLVSDEAAMLRSEMAVRFDALKSETDDTTDATAGVAATNPSPRRPLKRKRTELTN